MISAAAHSVWAKSDRDTGDSMSLWRHMTDSAGVAARLWDEWLPESVKQQIVQGSGSKDEPEARTLVMWLAATHDSGKIHPRFSYQVPGLADNMRGHTLPIADDYTPEQRIPHSVLGYSILRDWLESNRGFSPAIAASYASISGGHHGVPPNQSSIRQSDETLPALRGAWHEVQKELLDACAEFTGANEFLDQWRTRRLSPESQMLLTGVVIIADWNVSDPEIFGYNDYTETAQRVAKAWAQRLLPPPWRAPRDRPPFEESFAGRFGLPADIQPNAMQRKAVEVATGMAEPGLMVIEAGMGEGKTEAAFAAAEVFASKWGLGGVIIGLPTQATSNGMLTRFLDWVEKLPDSESANATRSVFLAHSKSSLNDEFAGLPRYSSISSVYDEATDSRKGGDEPHAVIAHQWLSGRKKGLLANFVVGTVDQILFSALQSKHVVLRHLSLVGKVVIIDEVHAYDSFMNEYLKRVLHWLARYEVPVIMLSATLPAATRQALMEAYENGRKGQEVPLPAKQFGRRRTPKPEPAKATALDGNPGYPLVIASSSTGPTMALPKATSAGIQVRLQAMADEVSVLVADVKAATADGGCVGIICNTVDRAQEVLAALAEVCEPEELILDHSRFAAPDRAEVELRIRELLGPDEFVARAGRERPHRLIVVGTQVLEQSLDIDFDLLVSDFAPTDLLLQRIGRLHRRRTPAKPRLQHFKEPTCWVRGVVDWESEPPEFDKGSIAVYGQWALLRSASVLENKRSGGEKIAIPSEIPDLVQAAYAEEFTVPSTWASVMDKAVKEHEELLARKVSDAQTFLLKKPEEFTLGAATGFLETNRGDAKEETKGMARVRDIDESIEVILMYRSDGARFLPHLTEFGDQVVPMDTPPEYHMARALSSCTVRLPGLLCQWYRVDKVLHELEADGVAAWQKSPWLKGQLVLFLDESLTAVIDGVELHYDKRLGLQHKTLDKGDS
ncbi:CRISPR-associated helicase Cas3' [Arthrobacter sp. HLT1-20]